GGAGMAEEADGVGGAARVEEVDWVGGAARVEEVDWVGGAAGVGGGGGVGALSGRPRAARRPGRAPQRALHSWGARRMTRTRLARASPCGAAPRMCRPSRIAASLTSHR